MTVFGIEAKRMIESPSRMYSGEVVSWEFNSAEMDAADLVWKESIEEGVGDRWPRAALPRAGLFTTGETARGGMVKSLERFPPRPAIEGVDVWGGMEAPKPAGSRPGCGPCRAATERVTGRE